MAEIRARREQRLSPWVRLVEKEVVFAPGAAPATYHMLAQADYVGVLARTPGGLIPIVRQYRPAVESYTWELVGGLLEPGEEPEVACRRELLEETGLVARHVVHLGTHFAEVGRLENRHHCYYVDAGDPDPGFTPEPGLTLAFVTLDELRRRAADGELAHPLHLAILLLFELKRSRHGGPTTNP